MTSEVTAAVTKFMNDTFGDEELPFDMCELTDLIRTTIVETAKKPELKLKTDKKPKDPAMPKRNKNAYMFFAASVRPQVLEELGDVKQPEIAKRTGEMWREMSAEDKEEFEQQAAEDKERYDQQMEEYEPSEGFELPKKLQKQKDDKPKRACSAFIFFSQAKRQEVIDEYKLDNKEVTSKLGELWREMEDKDKEEFEQQAAEDKERFDQEMAEWDEANDTQFCDYEFKMGKHQGEACGKRVNGNGTRCTQHAEPDEDSGCQVPLKTGERQGEKCGRKAKKNCLYCSAHDPTKVTAKPRTRKTTKAKSAKNATPKTTKAKSAKSSKNAAPKTTKAKSAKAKSAKRSNRRK